MGERLLKTLREVEDNKIGADTAFDILYIRRHSVSLVYINKTGALLRVLVLEDCNSDEEALGKAIKYFEEETKDYALDMKVVLEVKQ